MDRPRFKVPHTLVLLFGMIVLAWLATLVLPAGSFERATNEHGREQVVPGTYERLPAAEVERLPPTAVLTAVPEGLAAAAEIIFFVFIIGGAFAVFRATGAADAAIGVLLGVFGNRPVALVAGGVALFAVGSATIGMAEEYIPFVPVLVALFLALGYDTVTAVGVLCVGYGIGYGAALINPFTVFIAQEVAGVEQASGLGYRSLLLAAFLAVGIHHVWSYARRVRADPEKSYVAGLPVPEGLQVGEHPRLDATRIAVLVMTVATLVLLVFGIKLWDWYLVEMGALFLGLTVVLAAIARFHPDRAAGAFTAGAAELTTTALLIGFARAIEVVLSEARVIDTIVWGIAQPLQQLGSTAAAVGMFFVQSLANLFIPSGSGQAYVTMPLMAPLADLVRVSRQVAVLAFQFGDGFTNILVPTNAVLIGILAIAGVPYERWLRFVLPFMVKMWVLGSLALAVAVWIGWS
ncbi:MAG TPA: TIGR00366 family protein [Thermoanaerobaculia bacterium]|nr:TIGR00366 family protein [Thermoanaerobaculia bacterium]